MRRLAHRVMAIETAWRPRTVAAVIGHVRHCSAAEGQRSLLHALQGLDHVTIDAIMTQLTDGELELVAGMPNLGTVLDTLPDAELEAVAAGEPTALRRCRRAWQRHQGRDTA